MKLNENEVENIAHLARVEISAAEAAAYAADLSSILQLVAQMNAVDTDSIKPMAHPHEAPLRLREDEVTETNQREKLMANAPLAEKGLFLVPKVIE
ncbi:MAG: Asp-tRNA(Asn)/Glu-tRNA(Gln) amidotransferase GatCAB subunit C [Gammaproteobacteria bacterium]|nr:MAG: Asp-tRNA(Asn)/Glu-tRNA(Gln) amidotransferase GatCAB subunit C [Gammaproteobacteria bacterium]